jgi:hypothetical protein
MEAILWDTKYLTVISLIKMCLWLTKEVKCKLCLSLALAKKKKKRGVAPILILNLGLFHDQEKLGQLLWGSLDMKKIIVLFNFK